MISTIQNTLSGFVSSFTSTKEPKLLARPALSPQPIDPTISPTAAHMPRSGSNKSSTADSKREKRSRARDFLRKNFGVDGEADDPIEVWCHSNVLDVFDHDRKTQEKKV
jgi:hypothetical protein